MQPTLTFAVFLAVVAFTSAQVDPPTIQKIEVLSGSSARITWQTTPQTNPSRFRIRVTPFEYENSTQEWPAQIRRVNYDSEDAPYKQLETASNYECFNLCIQDPDCAFVVRSSSPKGNNCFLKKDASKVTNATLDPDSEYGVVDAYSNSSLIDYLSSNAAYYASLSVYDSVVKQWSNFSGISNFAISNRFVLTFTRTGVTAGRLNWQMVNPYTYSRFGLLVSANQSDFAQFTDINNATLQTFEHPTRYFSIEDYSKFIVATSQQACIDACFNQFSCVQLVYFSEDFNAQDGTKIASKNSCYLNTKLDMANGIYRKSNTTVLHVRDTRSSIDLSKADFGAWKFMLQTWTPYGVLTNSSGIASYNMTDASPVLKGASISMFMNVTWQIPEPLTLKRGALYYTVNDSSEYTYSISASSDFIDSAQKELNVSKFNECFEACYKSMACLAYVYQPSSSKCLLKTSTDRPTPCLSGNTCGIIPESVVYDFSIYPYINTQYCFYAYATTSFDYTTPVGRLICTSTLGTVSIEQTDNFYPGQQGRLRCFPRDYNNMINWYHNLKPLDINALSGSYSTDKTIVTFYNITSRLHNGVYSCENILSNGQVVYSNNFVTVEVNETAPQTPFSPNVSLIGTKEKPAIMVTFQTDPFGLPIDCINLFYSQDDTHYKNKTYCSQTLRGGSIVIYEPFDCSYSFELQTMNSVGSSGISYYFKIPQDQCKESPQNNPPKTYFGGFVASICVAGLLLVVSAGLIIARINSKKQIFG